MHTSESSGTYSMGTNHAGWGKVGKTGEVVTSKGMIRTGLPEGTFVQTAGGKAAPHTAVLGKTASGRRTASVQKP